MKEKDFFTVASIYMLFSDYVMSKPGAYFYAAFMTIIGLAIYSDHPNPSMVYFAPIFIIVGFGALVVLNLVFVVSNLIAHELCKLFVGEPKPENQNHRALMFIFSVLTIVPAIYFLDFGYYAFAPD